MTKNFLSLITGFALCMITISVSCSKNDIVQPSSTQPQHVPGPPIQLIATDTVQVEDDNWQVSSAGYRSDLKPFANGRTIIDVFVSCNGRDAHVSPGKTVEFYGGHLENSGNQLTFFAHYNEIPFRSLSLTLIVNH